MIVLGRLKLVNEIVKRDAQAITAEDQEIPDDLSDHFSIARNADLVE
jgi:hypothetical protein